MVESVYPMIPVEQAQEIVLAQAEALARCARRWRAHWALS